MKCRKQLKYYNIPISNLWEVTLDQNTWTRVCSVAAERRCTISCITRYCVFRLVRKKNIRMFKAMEKLSCEIKSHYKTGIKKHRHIMCLYGDDEKLMRISAMQLNLTVSQLIRIAVYWFLPKIEDFTVKWNQIYYHGIKLCRFLSIERRNMFNIPFFDIFFYGKWAREHWWKDPRYPLKIAFTPDFPNNDFFQ